MSANLRPATISVISILAIVLLQLTCLSSSSIRGPNTKREVRFRIGRNEVYASNRGASILRKLARSSPVTAPYALDGSDGKSLILRLVATTATNRSFPVDANNMTSANIHSDEPWTFVTKNGTLVGGSNGSLNLKKLLETLDSNNFTSEVKFDNQEAGYVNITITNAANQDKIDAIILEELMTDAVPTVSLASLAQNITGTLKDKPRPEPIIQSATIKPVVRSKPTAQLEFVSITSPPLRGSFEMVAENYTMRKVTDEANIFAIKLLHQLNLEKLGSRNLIQSPFAVYHGLGLLLTGAQGETAKELDRALLGSQSGYELGSSKPSHDLDRPRLVASFTESLAKLYHSGTHHMRLAKNDTLRRKLLSMEPYLGGTSEQHLVLANNLLFAPSAFEISHEFNQTLTNYFNSTALSRIETGSTEAIHNVNSWIREVTGGVVPSIMNKKSTFDEFNVMSLLCTSWLNQQWRDTFYRVASPLRSNIRLKGHARQLTFDREPETLMEFVDDNRHSHFVEYIESRPSTDIHRYQSVLNGLMTDIVSVPFKDSNHRLLAIMPIASSSTNATQLLSEALVGQIGTASAQVLQSGGAILANSTVNGSTADLPDSSLLSRLIAAFAANPRKSMRALWSIVAPEILTKQTLQGIMAAKQRNITDEDGNVLDSVRSSLVKLSIPIMRSEADSSISAALNHIGVVNAFDPNQANFIGINGHPFNYHKLHLSNVISKTTFNLNERGINYDKTIRTLESLRIYPDSHSAGGQKMDRIKEDKDVSGDEVKTPVHVDDVKLNKPFMYFICDMKTKLILYTGVLRDPDQQGAR